jgi:NADH dehydrogenase [ubiquinone] 1 alpha subcomplex assembly factor 7
MPQSQFLLSLGLQPRLDKLLKAASTEERRMDIRKGAKRLIDPLGMGAQYQVMGIVSPSKEEVYPFPYVRPTPATGE